MPFSYDAHTFAPSALSGCCFQFRPAAGLPEALSVRNCPGCSRIEKAGLPSPRDRKSGGTTLIDANAPISYALNAGLRHAFACRAFLSFRRPRMGLQGRFQTLRMRASQPHLPPLSPNSLCHALSLECFRICTSPLHSHTIWIGL